MARSKKKSFSKGSYDANIYLLTVLFFASLILGIIATGMIMIKSQAQADYPVSKIQSSNSSY